MIPPLDESAWIYSAGLGEDWRLLTRKRIDDGMTELKAISRVYAAQAPASPLRAARGRGMSMLLRAPAAARRRLFGLPAFDYWLYLWRKHFSAPSGPENWDLQFGLLQGFAAALALEEGVPARLDACLDADAHLHLYGSPYFIEFPSSEALAPAFIEVSPRGLTAGTSRMGPVFFERRLLRKGGRSGPLTLRRVPEIQPGLRVEECGFLLTQAVTMHGLARQSSAARERFSASLSRALGHISQRDPSLHAEMTDLVSSLIPLENSLKHGSVSSSYVNLRGAICLSHSEDALLQAETLIHEFCHQKMNQLLTVEPILRPGQGGQVFFSPWRPDARRLRGLILGAHAFLNVAAYLVKSLSEGEYSSKDRVAVMTNVSRRLFEVDDALRTVAGYADLTDFGRRFILGMTRELTLLFHAVQWFPPALLAEARSVCATHRRRCALPGTGIHRAAGFVPRVKTDPFKRSLGNNR
jgi:HEXXH motif-containing protein